MGSLDNKASQTKAEIIVEYKLDKQSLERVRLEQDKTEKKLQKTRADIRKDRLKEEKWYLNWKRKQDLAALSDEVKAGKLSREKASEQRKALHSKTNDIIANLETKHLAWVDKETLKVNDKIQKRRIESTVAHTALSEKSEKAIRKSEATTDKLREKRRAQIQRAWNTRLKDRDTADRKSLEDREKRRARLQRAWNKRAIKNAKIRTDAELKATKSMLSEITILRDKYVDNSKKKDKEASKERLKMWKHEMAEKIKIQDLSQKYGKGTSQSSVNKTTFGSGVSRGITGSMDTFKAGIGQKLGTVLGYGAFGAAIGGVKLLYDGFKKVMDITIKYEKMFADLQARGGFTAKEMDKVTTSIFNVANATKFSVQEITEMSISMSKLGFSADKLIQVMPTVANVASAAGESLVSTGEAIAKTVNVFKLSADSYVEIGDVMTKAFTSSALDLKGYTMAMSYAGAAATATETDFVQLTSAMEVLADRGITASKIGSGLRNIFSKLGKEGVDLNDIIGDLADGTMTYGESVDLVGRRAANQLYILTGSYDELREKQTELYNSHGEAAERAAIQMATFNAQWDALWNSTETAAAQAGEGTLGFFAAIVRGIRMMSDSGIDQVAKDFAILNPEIARLVANGELMTKAQAQIADSAGFSSGMQMQGKKVGYKITNDEAQAITEQVRLLDVSTNKDKNKKVVDEEVRALKKQFFKDLDDAMNEGGQDALNSKLQEIGETYNVDMSTIFGEGITTTGEDVLKSMFGFDVSKLPDDIDKNTEAVALAISDWVEETDYKKRAKDGGIVDNKIAELNNILGEGQVKKYLQEAEGGGSYEFQAYDADKKKLLNTEEAALSDKKDSIDKLFKWLCEHNVVAYCKDKKKGGRGGFPVIPVFVKDPNEENRYAEEKARLLTLYKLRKEEPLEQRIIKGELEDNEKTHFAHMLKQREKYENDLKKFQGKIDKNEKGGKNRFDTVQNALNRNTSSMGQLEGKEATAIGEINRKATKVNIPLYEPALKAQEKFVVESIDLENELNDARSEFTKEKIYDKMELASENYYDAEIAIEDLQNSIYEANTMNLLDPLRQIDTSGAEDAVKSTGVKLEKLKGSRKKKSEGIDDKSEGDGGEELRAAEVRDYLNQAIGVASDFYNIWEQAREQELNELKSKVARELEIIQHRYDREVEMQEEALRAGNINQEEYEEARRRAEKKRIDAVNKENKKLFEAQKKNDLINAKADFIQQLSQAALGIWAAWASQPWLAGSMTALSAVAMGVQSGNQIKAINSRQFTPQKYEDGGMVFGRSHADGGVPFTVAGSNTPREMEGGEFIVRKDKVAANISELKRINGDSKPNTSYFSTGGQVPNSGVASSSDYTDILNQMITVLDKPVRAYVSNQDVSNSVTERKALTSKTTF